MTAMNGQSTENYKMYTYSLIALVILVFSLWNLLSFLKLIRNLIRKQIDCPIKDLIPIKGIRERLGIRLKFKK